MEWLDRPIKEITRNFLFDKLPSPLKSIRYLGLPGSQFVFEQKMIDAIGDSGSHYFHLFERSVPLCNHIRATTSFTGKLTSGDVDVYLSDLRKDSLAYNEYINSFDLIWLDYCGVMSHQRLELARSIVSNLNSSSYAAFTYQATREQPAVSLVLDKFDFQETYLRRVHFFSSFFEGMNVEIECLPYKDGVPMLLFVVKKSRVPKLIVHPYIGLKK